MNSRNEVLRVIVTDKTKANTFSLAPGVTGRLLLSGENIMFVLVELTEGSTIPMHSHPHEQMGMCLKGAGEFETENEKTIVETGMAYQFKGHEKHGVKIPKGGAIFLEIFSPPREDFLARIDE